MISKARSSFSSQRASALETGNIPPIPGEAMIEKRRTERFSLELPARLSVVNVTPEESMDLFTSNICADGAFFPIRHPLPVGTDVALTIVLSMDKASREKKKGALIKVTGTVVRTNDQGMAICFDEEFKLQRLEPGYVM